MRDLDKIRDATYAATDATTDAATYAAIYVATYTATYEPTTMAIDAIEETVRNVMGDVM